MSLAVERVGVVGASARAAAHSLARAGRTAWAVDLFGDRDLTRIAPGVVCPIDRYPGALPALAAQLPPGPLVYTGGLENHPNVIAELAATRPLWGNPPHVIARVRDPHTLAETLEDGGFAVPRVLPARAVCPSAGRWLVKAKRSSGGVGVRWAAPGQPVDSGHYLQEFVPGAPMSAVFVGDGTRTDLFGVTEQIIGAPWLHARPFGYAGNIGPVALAPELQSELIRLGEWLTSAFGLVGVYGVDFILHEGRALVIEVNPRYTASIEVIEHATHRGIWADRGSCVPEVQVVGKAIYHTGHRIPFPLVGPWDGDLAGDFDPWRLPAFADIPGVGSIIEPGWPVLTILAGGSSTMLVRDRLQSRAAELDALFSKACR